MIFHKVGRKLGPEYEEERLLAEEKKVSVEEAVRKEIAKNEENNLVSLTLSSTFILSVLLNLHTSQKDLDNN